MNPSVTLSISIAAKPVDIAAYVADARNMPQWAGGFCKSVRKDGDDWVVETGEGEVGLRFLGPTSAGILDHIVTLAPGIEVYVPMRVLTNEEGSEVLFTLFQPPAMTDFRLQQDMALVRADLQQLKRVIESGQRNPPTLP